MGHAAINGRTPKNERRVRPTPLRPIVDGNGHGNGTAAVPATLSAVVPPCTV